MTNGCLQSNTCTVAIAKDSPQSTRLLTQAAKKHSGEPNIVIHGGPFNKPLCRSMGRGPVRIFSSRCRAVDADNSL